MTYKPAVQSAVGGWIDGGAIGFSATTTPPTKGTVLRDKMWYRRVGDSMEIRYEYEHTAAGASGTGMYKVPIPAGFAIDVTKVRANTTVSTSSDGVQFTTIGNAYAGNVAGNTITLMNVNVYDASFLTAGGIAYNGTSTIRYQFDAGNTGVSFSQTNLRFSAHVVVPIVGWSANPGFSNTKTFRASEQTLTRVTSTPTAIGQYRSRLRSASSVTYSTDSAPSTAPGATNGFFIDTGGRAWATADPAGSPTYFEVFIGVNKHYRLEVYQTSGRTGAFDPSLVIRGTSSWGTRTHYDPTTGVLTVIAFATSTSTTAQYAGETLPASGNVANFYFDVIVSDTALPTDISAASIAEIFAESAVEKPVRPDRIKYSPGVAKAWVRYSNTAAITIASSYNVTSMTDNGVGVATVNFTNPISNAAIVSTGGASHGRAMTTGTPTTTSVQITGLRTDTFVDDDMGLNNVVVYGEL